MASKTTVPGDTGLMLWVVLARAFDAVDRHSRASIARFGLGTTEFGVLEVLYHKGELPVCGGSGAFWWRRAGRTTGSASSWRGAWDGAAPVRKTAAKGRSRSHPPA